MWKRWENGVGGVDVGVRRRWGVYCGERCAAQTRVGRGWARAPEGRRGGFEVGLVHGTDGVSPRVEGWVGGGEERPAQGVVVRLKVGPKGR